MKKEKNLDYQIELLKNRICIYQDNNIDTTELCEQLDRLCTEALRKMFEENPPEQLFAKLTQNKEDRFEELEREFNEKYMKDLPDIPIARFKVFGEKMLEIWKNYVETSDKKLLGDFEDLCIEISSELVDYFFYLEEKKPGVFSNLPSKIFRSETFENNNDVFEKTCELYSKLYQEMLERPYDKETYYLYNHFSCMPSWILEYMEK